ncbi:hypothetical protein ACFQAT_22880 [Undibacterium arcticum]|uniref:Transmembrane protein n=1 Tax=Undibacterium arcticum TaxID=1762892 RepID=A0ABV7F258_9BURK
MTEAANSEIQHGTAPSAEENAEFQEEKKFYFEWARESIKSSIALANDILKQLVTLNTALLGGASVLLNEELIDPAGKFFIVFLFFVALIISFIGMFPYEAPWRESLSEHLNEIKNDKSAALEHKWKYIRRAGTFMAFGFGVAIFGLALQLCHR